MSDLQTEAQELNLEIINAHNKHYESSTTGLINPKESPNGNTIYHLYSDGQITFQKGGWAYLQRSEFTEDSPFSAYRDLQLKFPKEADNGNTYVILTKEECKYFRSKMFDLVKYLYV
jgi:hypothetical protein